GFNVVKLSVETSLVRNVPPGRKTADRVGLFNHHASMSAFRWEPDEGRVCLHCSAYVHPETFEIVKTLFGAAVALQAADAHIKVDAVAHLLRGEPDVSVHPVSGPRSSMDDMLNVVEQMFAPAGRGPGP